MSNTIRFNLALIGVLAWAFSSYAFVAHAQIMGNFGDLDIDIDEDSVSVDGAGIDVDIDGDEVDVNAGGTKVKTGNGNVDVNAGGTDISVDDDEVNVKTPAAQVRTTNSGTEVETGAAQVRTTSGTAAQKQTRTTAEEGATLRVMSSGDGINVQTRNALVSFEDDVVVTHIKGKGDLDVYVDLIEDEYDSIDSISVKGDTVTMSYSQPAKLFGLFSMSLGADVEVTNGKDVKVSLPWYSFLATKPGLKEMKKTITAQVKGASFGVDDVSVTADQAAVVKTAEVVSVTSQAVNEVYTEVIVGDGVSVTTGDTSVTTGDDGIHVDAGGTTVDIDDAGNVNVNY